MRTLPSGLSGEFRGLTAKDLRYLTNEKLVQDNEVEDYVLRHAWQGLVEPGPYDFGGDKDVDWGRVLVGDRIVGLLTIRVATFPGEPYTARVKCEDCSKSFDYDFDLEALLREKTQRLSPEDAETFAKGNRFEAEMPGTNAPFVFKLRTGAEAKKLASYLQAKKNGSKRMQERMNPLVDSVANAIVGIEGLKLNTQDARFDYLESLSMGDFQALVELMQSHDCGVDTDVDVKCTKCGSEQTLSLPFGQRGFFNPRSVRKKDALPSLDEPEESDAP